MPSLRNFFESTLSNFSNLFAQSGGAGRRQIGRHGDPETGEGYIDRGVNISDYVGRDHYVASALSSVYTKATGSRREFLVSFDAIKPFYIIQAILNALVEDALTPDVTTGEIVQIVSQNEKINQELRTFQESFNLDQHISDIIMDLLSYGEYTLRLVIEEGRGVIDIVDDIDQTRIVAFYAQGFPYRFLRQTDRDLEIYPAYKFVHFVYGRNKLRVKIENEFLEVANYKDEYGMPYPSYARVGRPLFYGVLSKVKELMVLEQLIPAQKINQLLTGSLVGLQVPASMSPDDGFKAARRYEDILNKHRGIDRSTGELTITDIMAVAGKIRVLPQFGDKGQAQSLNDIKENHNVDDLLGTIRDIRETICSSMGFPAEILFGGDAQSKNDFLKRYSRYLRKLKDVQHCIASGLTQICLAHLVNKGYTDVKADDLQIVFRNELIAIDELERLEFQDGVTTMIANIHRFVEEIGNGAYNNFVNERAYQAFVYQAFSLFGRDINFINPPEGYKEHGKDIRVSNIADLQRDMEPMGT